MRKKILLIVFLLFFNNQFAHAETDNNITLPALEELTDKDINVSESKSIWQKIKELFGFGEGDKIANNDPSKNEIPDNKADKVSIDNENKELSNNGLNENKPPLTSDNENKITIDQSNLPSTNSGADPQAANPGLELPEGFKDINNNDLTPINNNPSVEISSDDNKKTQPENIINNEVKDDTVKGGITDDQAKQISAPSDQKILNDKDSNGDSHNKLTPIATLNNEPEISNEALANDNLDSAKVKSDSPAPSTDSEAAASPPLAAGAKTNEIKPKDEINSSSEAPGAQISENNLPKPESEDITSKPSNEVTNLPNTNNSDKTKAVAPQNQEKPKETSPNDLPQINDNSNKDVNILNAPELEEPNYSSENNELNLVAVDKESILNKYKQQLIERTTVTKEIPQITSKDISKETINNQNYANKADINEDPLQAKFISNETQLLILPNDDIVLGKITKEAYLDQIDFRNYLDIFWKNYYYFKREAKRNEIEDFIDNYEELFE